MGDPRTEAAHARRRELRERLRDATTAEERHAIAHEVGRVGASIRRWRNRAAKGDLSPPRVKLREATRALEEHDRDGGPVEQRASLVDALNAARAALKEGKP